MLRGADAVARTEDVELNARREWTVLILICAFAIGFRLVRLGSLSFAGDEETTTLAALALLEGWPPTLPGGLVYLRALPFTVFEAIAVWAAGVDEFALRLFPVLMAGPRVAAAWWLARPYLGGPAALAVAAILAVTPLDVELSRYARMYSLFATLDLVYVAGVVHLCLGRRGASGIAAAGVFGGITHDIAVMHAPLPILGMLSRGVTRPIMVRLAAVTALALGAFAVARLFNLISYGETGIEVGLGAHLTPIVLHWQRIEALIGSGAAVMLAGIGALAVIFWTLAGQRDLQRPSARLALLAAGVAWLGASFALGVPLLLSVLVLEGVPLRSLVFEPAHRRLLYPALAGTLGWGAAALAGTGSIEAAARLLFGFPAPNWSDFASAAPLFFGLALAGSIVATERGARSSQPAIWLILIAAALAPALISGFVERSEGLRYQIHGLPPLLVLATLAARALAERISKRTSVASALAMLLVLIAVRPDQAVRALLREHGPVAEPFALLNVAPDHRGAAAFLREHAAADEWIVAEDPLEQHLYIGRTEIWLRRIEDAARFLKRPADGDLPRDIYTGARHVGDLAQLQALARTEGQRVVWLVTSGEVEGYPEFFRTAETDAILARWRPLAVFVGADGLTRVYRLVDGEPAGQSKAATAAPLP
jgi:hypothetical protein